MTKTINVSEELWRRLHIDRVQLRVARIEDVILKYIEIIKKIGRGKEATK